ncbi:hypothetical protein TNCV_2276751 [Trichonephila clavipes]|nr:hypothetical protein TNCV_2276751 [Trichonephila clavipes]
MILTTESRAAPAAFYPLSGTLIFLVLETWASKERGVTSGEGGPMVVQEALAMETIVDWRMAVAFKSEIMYFVIESDFENFEKEKFE